MKKNFINPYNIIIFGAKGDLACRKLIPALFQLEKKKFLHKNTKIIGVGRAAWNSYEYIHIIFNTLKNFYKKPIKKDIWNIFKYRLSFCNLDVCNTNQFFKLRKMLYQELNNNIYYFAIPPNTFANICKGLGKIKLNTIPNKIIVEKPIGTSLQSSKLINNQLKKYFQEEQIFRIDHYLGKETILNLLTLRFSNFLFYNNWDHNTIDHVQIIISETIGIEGRWSYFDKIGQMRDMVQNHLLQILSIIAMNPPKKIDFHHIKKEKIKVLQALRKIDIHNIHTNTVKGQYTTGVINGKTVPSYVQEIGSRKYSNTETFVAIKAYIDNERWHNVPFYLKTGKRLSDKKSEIIIYFKKVPIKLFSDIKYNHYSNKLKVKLQPNEGIEIEFLNKIPDINSTFQSKPTILQFNYQNTFKKSIPEAYERLLLESMKNNQALFVSQNEIEVAWKWIDSIIQAWDTNNMEPELYHAGTWGPKSCTQMIKKNKHHWDHH